MYQNVDDVASNIILSVCLTNQRASKKLPYPFFSKVSSWFKSNVIFKICFIPRKYFQLLDSMRFHCLSVLFHCLTVKIFIILFSDPLPTDSGLESILYLVCCLKRLYVQNPTKFFPIFTICTIFSMMLRNFPGFSTQFVCKNFCIPKKPHYQNT